jgi:hypothetical protein
VIRTQDQQKQSDQDLTSARLDVERYQKSIEFSQKKLVELDLALADPSISGRDRQFAFSGQATQLEFLRENQGNLRYAEVRLKELQEAGVASKFTPLPQMVPEGSHPTLRSILENTSMDPVVLPGESLLIKPGDFLNRVQGSSK